MNFPIRLTAIAMPRWEAILTRCLLAWLLWGALPAGSTPWTSQPHPVGLGQYFDFTWVSDPASFERAFLISRAGLICFALGILPIFGLAAFLIADVSLHTLASSQGFQGHGAQLNALLALGLMSGYLWHALAHFRSRGILRQPLLFDSGGAATSALQGARLMLAATYVVSGLSKITRTGLDWPMHGDYFVLQILKAQDEMRATHIDAQLSSSAVAFGEFLAANPWVATLMLFGALTMELGAFLALLGRRWALLIGIGLWLFHKCNEWLMGLPFEGNQWAVIFLFIMPPYWLISIPAYVVKGRAVVHPSPTFQPQLSLWKRLARHPAVITIMVAVFLLWRGDWYPFSNFPMYSRLSKSTTSLLATDLDGNTIPFLALGTNAPTVKKRLRTELNEIVKNSDIDKVSEIPAELRQQALERVNAALLMQPNSNYHQHPPFRLIQKTYRSIKGKITISSEVLGEFPAENGTEKIKTGDLLNRNQGESESTSVTDKPSVPESAPTNP